MTMLIEEVQSSPWDRMKEKLQTKTTNRHQNLAKLKHDKEQIIWNVNDTNDVILVATFDYRLRRFRQILRNILLT